MASVFLYHVVGDLTVGKPVLVEFYDNEPVESALRAIADTTEGGIPVWKRKQTLKGVNLIEGSEVRLQRFVGILNSLDIVSFLAKAECLEDQEKAMRTPVAEVLTPNSSLLKEVDPGTRLIDALEMMKQGVRRLLVPKSVGWRGMSKRFSILYHGKWLKNIETSSSPTTGNRSSSSSAPRDSRFCCLSREDVLRFIIGCLGALAPIPLSSISNLGAINTHFCFVDASAPAIYATRKPPQDPCAIAVVEPTPDGQQKIIGEISASKMWKCNYLGAAWALANLSAGQFVMGSEDQGNPTFPDFSINAQLEDMEKTTVGSRPWKFSSRSVGFFSNPASSMAAGAGARYRGRSAPLTCKVTSSLAAVMAQMLSHRAAHVWVTEEEAEDVLVGVVSYTDILFAVTKNPSTVISTIP
ncbi:CBS domain-containing protein CBSX6 [Aristolochia californica]|uniref:CBS domain-containing protein CBSX6 n=1 Tax=Aristolochia californica TaxID=171875 RepID=UPI0035DC4949